MSESIALAVRPQLTPSTWQMIESIAPAMYKSSFFAVSSAEQAQAIMIKGFELGLPLAASFELIHVIKGKPALSPRGALAIIQNSGAIDVKITRLVDAKGTYIGHECWMKRKSNGFEYCARFTLDDAKRADLIRPDSGWVKYPEQMALWRCVGFAADVVCPDLIGGLKRADEYGAAIDVSGNVIEGQWTAVPAQAPTVVEAPVLPPAPPAITLDQLVQQYGAEVVMVAAEGRIPATDEEVQKVAEKLKAEN